MIDLPTAVFLQLNRHFFKACGEPLPFELRDKRNTQDDPFDELLATEVLANLEGIRCVKSPGPLITPDMVLYRPDRLPNTVSEGLSRALDCILGLEVKKLQRTAQGHVARASGLDFNTTPPCGKVRVYDASGTPVDIPGFYLFICLEPTGGTVPSVMVTALCLVDGNVLNTDFELYLATIGERTKRLRLGSYGDGADRARPMFIFANPLGTDEFNHNATLIHPTSNLHHTMPTLSLVYRLHRSTINHHVNTFYCYQVREASAPAPDVIDLYDPFPTPRRDTRTRSRGRFRLPFQL